MYIVYTRTYVFISKFIGDSKDVFNSFLLRRQVVSGARRLVTKNPETVNKDIAKTETHLQNEQIDGSMQI